MLPKRLLVALIVFFAGVFGSAGAQASCVAVQTPLTYTYQAGSISISYDMCTSVDTSTNPPTMMSYASTTMSYDNVSYDGSFSLNGSMSMQLNFSGSDFSSIVFNGGPLYITAGGTQYEVYFNDLSYSLNDAFQVGDPQGSLTINGVTYPADPQYFAYLFR